MNNEQAKAFGAMLRERRRSLGLTIRDVERTTDIDNATISRIETGSFKAPRPDKLARIAEALGMTAGEVFAQAGYLVPDDLPDYATYLATKHPELPHDERERLNDHFAELLGQLGLIPTQQPAFEEQNDDSPGEDR